MKTKRMFSMIGLTLLALSPTTWAAGHGGGGGGFGGGGHFGGGGFGGGAHFGGGGGFHGGGFGGARMSPGARFSFGARPLYGHPVYARSAGRSVMPFGRSTTASNRTAQLSRPVVARPSNERTLSAASNRQRNITSTSSRAGQTSRLPAARPTDRQPESARNHIFAREDGSMHRDWDRRGAHFFRGHWWVFDSGLWLGLDAGFFPWDYYPYYAYDYYPYDYYPGYYADVEPEYYSAGVSSSVDQYPDPNVTAVQTDLTKLGYYHGPIDGLFGRATRDALARYQTDHDLAVTGTLTTETLQSLGLLQATPS
jgi:hypothetical protein